MIEEGTGPEAAAGDTVIVDYVGVRTRDGVEFDNSYDRFEPFPVVLGQGGVIPGWDQGLVGVQAGARVRLDIPSDLAYGAEARGDIIGENEALTFLIDVRAVIPPADPADAPTEMGVPESEGATETTYRRSHRGRGHRAAGRPDRRHQLRAVPRRQRRAAREQLGGRARAGADGRRRGQLPRLRRRAAGHEGRRPPSHRHPARRTRSARTATRSSDFRPEPT